MALSLPSLPCGVNWYAELIEGGDLRAGVVLADGTRQAPVTAHPPVGAPGDAELLHEAARKLYEHLAFDGLGGGEAAVPAPLKEYLEAWGHGDTTRMAALLPTLERRAEARVVAVGTAGCTGDTRQVGGDTRQQASLPAVAFRVGAQHCRRSARSAGSMRAACQYSDLAERRAG